ncbi:MAG: hypothetical protein WD898_02820 [Candidatus Paceibacterota bacterium]
MPRLQYRNALCNLGPSNQPGPPADNSAETPESLEAAANDAERRASEAGSRREYEEAQRLQSEAERLRTEAGRLRSATPPPPTSNTSDSSPSDGCNCPPVVVNRDEDLIAHAWYRFLQIMLYIGGVAIILWVLWFGFKVGRWTAPTAAVEKTAPATAHSAPPAPQPEVKPSPTPHVEVEVTGLKESVAGLKSVTDKLVSAMRQRQAPAPPPPPSLEIPSRVEIEVDVRHHTQQEPPLVVAPEEDYSREEEKELSSGEKFRRFMERYRRGEI